MSRQNNDIRVFPYEQAVLKELNPEGYSSLVGMFEQPCARYAQRPAFTAIGQTLTFADIDRMSRDFAAYLVGSAGLVPGQRMAIQLPNLCQYPIVAWGVLRAALVEDIATEWKDRTGTDIYEGCGLSETASALSCNSEEFRQLGTVGRAMPYMQVKIVGANGETLGDGEEGELLVRGFQFRGEHFLLGMPGVIYRSDRPEGGFQPRDRLLFEPDMRHAGVWVEGSLLQVLWSRVGDAPESILYSRVGVH